MRITADRLAVLSIGCAIASWWLLAILPTSAHPGMSAAVVCFVAVGLVFAIMAFWDNPPAAVPAPCPHCAELHERLDALRAELAVARAQLAEHERDPFGSAGLAVDDLPEPPAWDETRARGYVPEPALLSDSPLTAMQPALSRDLFVPSIEQTGPILDPLRDTMARDTLAEAVDAEPRSDTPTGTFYALDAFDNRGARHRADRG